MHVKSIAECSKGSILQYFRPSLSYHLSLRSLLCLFLSGGFTQALLQTQKLSNKSYDLMMSVEFSDGTIYSVNPDQTAPSAYALR